MFYVRTSYLTGDPADLDTSLAALKTDAPKILGDLPGYVGLSIFVDRELGKMMTASWWESPEAREASDTAIAERRAELFAPFARTVAFDRWEAPAYTADPDVEADAGFRMSCFTFDPANVDDVIAGYEKITMPGLSEIPGFLSTALLVDRAAGQGRVGAIYRDRAALVASRGPQAATRSLSVRSAEMASGHVTVRTVEEFEVALFERKPTAG
jgi:hypothetical protein